MADRIIGPSGESRRRRSLALLSFAGLLALALALWLAIGAGAVVEESGFEDDDGNLAPNSATPNFDWNSFKETTWSTDPAAPYRESDKVVSGWTFKGIEDAQKPADRNDTQFAGGTKQDDVCPTVNTTGNVLNKDDLKRIYLSTKVIGTHTYLNLAWARVGQNSITASAHVAFEFNKGETACGPPSDDLVERTDGDMLIVYDFEGGDADPLIKLARWTTTPGDTCDVASHSPTPNGCWGTAEELTSLPGVAEAKVNADGNKNTNNDVIDEIAPSPDETLGEAEFGEAGIDLTDADVFTPGTCETFGTAFAVSRTSGNSGQAQMTDLVGPADFTLANCGTVITRKVTDPAGDTTTNFGYTTNVTTTPVTDPLPSPFSLKDGESNTIINVNPATGRNVTEDDPGPGYKLTSIDCSESSVPATNYSTDTTTRAVTFSIAAGETLDCTFTNTLQQGAIEVTKTRKYAAACAGEEPPEPCDANNQPHPGVDFTVNGVTKATDANGKACFDGLAFDTYDVTETEPAGYQADGDLTKEVTVDNNATCDDETYVGETVSFSNTPLTDIDVDAAAQDPGATQSKINCVDADDNDVGNSGADFVDPASADADDLEPGIYTCTVNIDP